MIHVRAPRTMLHGLLALACAATAQQPGVGLDVLTEPCVNSSAPTFKNQTWVLHCAGGSACTYESGGFPGLCVRGGATETNLVLAKCDPSDSSQLFTFQPASGAIAQMPLSVGQFWNVYGGLLEREC